MKKLLVIGFVWPEPKTTAAGNRMLQLLEAFLSYGYQTIFASTASKTTYSHDLIPMGVKEEQIQLNDSSFDDFVKGLNPDIVMFDRFMVEEQFGWRVAESCPKALRILNTEDLHSLREYRETCLKDPMGFCLGKYGQQDKTKREIASIYRSDLTLLVSHFEKEILENTFGLNENLLLYLPFMLPRVEENHRMNWPGFEERKDFISYGNGRHAPNIDAFGQLKNNIWPLIRKKLPGAKLHIYGAYLPEQIKKMHEPKQGFWVHGWVKDLEEKVQHARVLLAPLRFGAGIKGKLTLAMQNGTPSVTTNLGAEGMTKQLWSGAIANAPSEMAKWSIELHENPEKWYKAQQNGVSIINAEYTKNLWSKLLFQRLNTLKSLLKEHRANNFIGALLLHQSMAATKYMGKWIEEKNTLRG